MSQVTTLAHSYEALGRGLILLGAFVSFVLGEPLVQRPPRPGQLRRPRVPSILALGGLTASVSR